MFRAEFVVKKKTIFDDRCVLNFFFRESVGWE